MLDEAGFPAGVVNIVPAGREVGRAPRHPPRRRQGQLHRLAPRPAASIGAFCGEQLKRCTLELGGKSAAIILDDADLADRRSPSLLPNSIMNNGQACVAQTRILAQPRALRRGRRGARRARSAKPGRGRPRSTPPPTSARSSPSASATGSRATSPRARRKAPASPSAAAVRPASTRAGSSSPRSSPTSTTR